MAGSKNEAFKKAYTELNDAQRQAVDQIDGPVLVMAGPGTGKTQLLSARVANILRVTDTLPQNILCLTFTENGAANMRERLTRFIGQAAYDVPVSTYHAFGGDLIWRFPEYFAETRLQNPVDELGKHQLLQTIVDNLSYTNPLKQIRHHLGDLISTVSEVKRALLTADDLRTIATENTQFIRRASQEIAEIFANFTMMPRKLDKALPYFEQTLAALQKLAPAQPASKRFGSLATAVIKDVHAAITDATGSDKTTSLTSWKNTWLVKNSDNQFVLAGDLQNRRVEALANVFEQYQNGLAERGWYDFDDMIIRAVAALEQNSDLRYTLQEQYLYMLLDEFQDTNAAQLRLVELLTDNPVSEGRPNVMAVGDDDQAIYAFQGAQYSNMLDFYKLYRDVAVIHLTENYRSHHDVLHAAHNIAEQIDVRLQHTFMGMSKTLVAAQHNLPAATIERQEFLSAIAENHWIASAVAVLIKQGTPAHEIAVIAPAHKYLTALVPYLNAQNIPVRYEKRENILDAPVVQQLLTMSKLVLALGGDNEELANALWPQVLSFDFWQIPVGDIWKISWQIGDDKAQRANWAKALLDEPDFKKIALLFLALATKTETETCESMLDYLIGTEAVETHEPGTASVQSPLREFYTSADIQKLHPERFYETLSHLTVLRARLREYEATQDNALKLADLINFVAMYESAEQRMINTSPYNQQADAVQLMTVFKAKGLEFEHVFLPAIQDEVWGSSARGSSNKLTLPANLAPIRHAGANEDERLRILFVAMTRAKFGLHLTSSTQNYTGKATRRLKYLDEQEQPDGTFKSRVLPEHAQTVTHNDHDAPALELLELDWRQRHAARTATTELRDLLAERLKNYRLSPTHLNTFTDVVFGGPEKFFMSTLLKFPQAPTLSIQYGNAIHETMEWLQHRVDDDGIVPPIAAVTHYFGARMHGKKLMPAQLGLELERGERALAAYLAERSATFRAGDRAEYNFRDEGVFVGEARLSGKIDRMIIDKSSKTITVIDYKTSRSYAAWKSDAGLHKYKRQLYCYKLLIEGSHTFAGYKANVGQLEFIEPDSDNRINALKLNFDSDELEQTRKLLQIMWRHVMQLNFPDITTYPSTLAGIKQFEADLLEGTI
jgi:DNA helicase-2/ATP-dependent DNA helicase PcrA